MVLWMWKLSYDLLYALVLSKKYSHWHAAWSFNSVYYLIGAVMIHAFSKQLYLLRKSKKASDIIVQLLFFVYFVPAITYCSLGGADPFYLLFVILYFTLLVWLNGRVNLQFLQSSKIAKGLERGALGRKFVQVLPDFMLLGFVLIGIMIIAYYGNLKINIFTQSAYETRRVMSDMKLPVLIRMLRVWATYITPFSIVFYWVKGKKWFAGLLSLVQLAHFNFDGYRSTLLLLGIAVLCISFFERLSINRILLGLTATSVLGIAEYTALGSNRIANIAGFRFLLVPPLYGSLCFDFFSQNELDFLRTSILRRFGFVSPYANYQGFSDYTYLIGNIYNKSQAENANTGLCGDAFANFGWWSLLLYPAALVLILKVVDRLSEKVDNRLLMFFVILYTVMLTNGSLFTVILSNGLAIMSMILYLVSLSKKAELRA